MAEYNFVPLPQGFTAEEHADDMLINAETRIGGLLGVGSQEGFRALKEGGYIGAAGTLTRRGVQRAKKLQRELGWI